MILAQRALCVLCVLCAACAASESNETQCKRLQKYFLKLDSGLESANVTRGLSERGAARTLRLAGGGGAARAAHALLRALIVHALRYPEHAVLLDNRTTTLRDLAAIDDYTSTDQFILSLASAWRGESTTLLQCASGACGVAGPRLGVLRRGAVPVARRLLARLAPAAAAAGCLRDWTALRRPHCGFFDGGLEPKYKTRSDLTNDTCPPDGTCMIVVVNTEEDETPAREMLRRSAAALSPPLELRFAPLSDADLRAALRSSARSFLFLDYDMWADGANERVEPAPPLPCPASAACPDSAVSLAVADVRKLTRYAPPVMQLALRFRPPPALLRRILDNTRSLTPDEAACEAAHFYGNVTRKWLTCDDDSCDPKPNFRVYACDWNITYYIEIGREIKSYWLETFNKSDHVNFFFIKTNCSDIDDVSSDFNAVVTNFSLNTNLQGVIAMGAAAATSLQRGARRARVPLLLVAAPPPDVPLLEARSTAAALPALATATRALLARCGWRRVALLREEGRCHQWKRSAGLGEALRAVSGDVLRMEEAIVRAENEGAALDWLRARDARVVLVDASARTAAGLLRAAQARGLAPAAGYAWLVLGAAGETSDADWQPGPQFSYVTVSGGWRGGAGARGLRGAELRARLHGRLGGAWTPHATAFADAILLAMEGARRLRDEYPQYRYDLHWENVDRTFFKLLDNVTVEGVTHDIHLNSSPPVFAHLWSAGGARLVGVWGAPGAAVDERCGAVAVRDAAACHTTHSGDAFTPHCHDFAWAVAACVLALGPPALWAARAARRRRLTRRDRAVEERALLRQGHSAAEAAAGAALAEHAVPRSALRLIDELGTGHCGVVRLAVLQLPGSAALAVAAKTPRGDAPAGAAAEMLREAALLATLRHEHVVRFAGVCWEGGPLVLMEHVLYGDLRRYLRQRRPAAELARCGLPEPAAADVAAAALTRLAREAAAALCYLERRGLVHRDVRAANCLVDARHSLKLGDFGMARRLVERGAGEGEYLCKRRAMFPVLWMAPESLARGVFSAASDVWALGVLLLELATLGERPYGAWSTARVLRHARQGGAPPLPCDAAPATRYVTAACWRRAPEQRPTAAELVAWLAEHPRAVQPALDLPAAADADADPDAHAPSPDSGLYIDEWTVH